METSCTHEIKVKIITQIKSAKILSTPMNSEGCNWKYSLCEGKILLGFARLADSVGIGSEVAIDFKCDDSCNLI